MAKPVIKVTGLENLIKDLNKLPINLQKNLDNYMQEAFNAMVITAQSLVPKNTGALNSSIGNSRLAPLSYSFYVLLYYAPYVEFGTGGLVDVPKELKEYAWQFKGAGIRQVNLPARPFWWPSFLKHKKELDEKISSHLLEDSMTGITVIKLFNRLTKFTVI